MTLESRKLLYGLAVALVLSASLAAAEEPPPAGGAAAPLGVCQDTIRTAALKLDSETRRAASACLTAGIECVLEPTDVRADCCAAEVDRCRGNLDKIEEAKRHFATSVEKRRCGNVAFADVAGSSGLGYASLAEACRALTPPASVSDLTELTSCLARLIVARTVCHMGTRELPRSADALTCVGLEEEFASSTGADLHTCNVSTPPTPCEDGKTVIVVSLDAPYAGAIVDLAYPGSVSIPLTGEAVADRVHFNVDAFVTAVNDHDQNGDAVDDTLTASLVGFGMNPAGPFVTVTFDCSGATAPPLGAFSCNLKSASDDGGMDITAQVGCTLGTP